MVDDMDEMLTKPGAAAIAMGGDTDPREPRRPRSSWPAWVPYAAALWSFGYGLVALVWTLTGSGFPLGENDPDGASHLLTGLPADVGAPLFAAVALAGAGAAALMARAPDHAGGSRLWWRQPALVFGWMTSVGWLVVVPDVRLLALVGYLPMLIVKAPFDAELRDALGEALSAAHLNHVAVIAGGFLWVFATLLFARRTSAACERCGRHAAVGGWTTPAAAARWGRLAAYVAATIPALYALTRWIWVAGLPLGIDAEFHAEGLADGSLWAGAWLGTFGLVGSVLTLGLVQRWGEVFPRWLPGLRGRRVPIGLAVVPASFVSVIVVSGGLDLIRGAFSVSVLGLTDGNWAAVGPALLWPLWGAALAAATLAYYLRRRGACTTCGRN
jgi:hypothetical protein